MSTCQLLLDICPTNENLFPPPLLLQHSRVEHAFFHPSRLVFLPYAHAQ